MVLLQTKASANATWLLHTLLRTLWGRIPTTKPRGGYWPVTQERDLSSEGKWLAAATQLLRPRAQRGEARPQGTSSQVRGPHSCSSPHEIGKQLRAPAGAWSLRKASPSLSVWHDTQGAHLAPGVILVCSGHPETQSCVPSALPVCFLRAPPAWLPATSWYHTTKLC